MTLFEKNEYMDFESDEIDENEVEKENSDKDDLPELPRFLSKQPIDIDCDRIMVGNEVLHHIFGSGKITQIDKEKHHIRVKFEMGEKLFLFPDAFKMEYLKTKEN